MRPKLTIFAIVSVMLLMIVAYPLSPIRIIPSVHAGTVTITLIGSLNGWNYSQPSGTNPTITVRDTDNVFLTLRSADVQHQFYVDVNGNGIPDCNTTDLCSASFNSTSPANYGWIAGVLPQGTYTYYCSYHPVPMHGTIRVIAGTSDFTVSANPFALTIVQASSKTSTITVTSLNNYSGTVNLLASPPNGITTTFNPTNVSPPKNGTATSTLNVTVAANAAPGSYSIGITAINDTTGPIRTATVNVQVVAPSFTLSASTSSISIVQGNSGTAIITITSTNGFSGSVSLRDQVSPSGPTASQSPSSVSVTPIASQTSTLTVTSTSTFSPGNYTITIIGNATGPNGPITNSLTISLKISSAPAAAFPLSPVLLGGVVAAIVLIALIIALARRRSRRLS